MLKKIHLAYKNMVGRCYDAKNARRRMQLGIEHNAKSGLID